MKTFEKLAVRIKKDLDIELYKFERCRVGRSQRASGAWSWRAQRIDDPSHNDYGSCYSATELLREKEPLTLERSIRSTDISVSIGKNEKLIVRECMG